MTAALLRRWTVPRLNHHSNPSSTGECSTAKKEVDVWGEYLDWLLDLGKDGWGGLAAPIVHLSEDEGEVELLSAVEQEIDEVDADDDDQVVGLLDPGKQS